MYFIAMTSMFKGSKIIKLEIFCNSFGSVHWSPVSGCFTRDWTLKHFTHHNGPKKDSPKTQTTCLSLWACYHPPLLLHRICSSYNLNTHIYIYHLASKKGKKYTRTYHLKLRAYIWCTPSSLKFNQTKSNR